MNANDQAGSSTGNKAKAGGSMPLTGHLRELRRRILICLAMVAAGICIGLWRAPQLVHVLIEIGEKNNYTFVYISPEELLLVYFQIAFIFAACLALPVILYELYAFASPGLRGNEKHVFAGAMAAGFGCLWIGVFFAHKILLPFMLKFLIDLSHGSGINAQLSVKNYISFLLTVYIIFGIIFELPVVSVLLTQLGILKVDWMKKSRKVVIVVIFFVAAVITPPDIASQIMVAIPMLTLFELSIWLCTLFEKMKKQETEDVAD